MTYDEDLERKKDSDRCGRLVRDYVRRNPRTKTTTVITHVVYSELDRMTDLVGSKSLAIRLGELGVTVEMLCDKVEVK